MNDTVKIIQTIGIRDSKVFAVLETPCFPCAYYGGIIRNGAPADNATYLYHRTVQEAINAATKMYEKS